MRAITEGTQCMGRGNVSRGQARTGMQDEFPPGPVRRPDNPAYVHHLAGHQAQLVAALDLDAGVGPVPGTGHEQAGSTCARSRTIPTTRSGEGQHARQAQSRDR